MLVQDFKVHVYYQSPSKLTTYYFTNILGDLNTRNYDIDGWKYENQTQQWTQWQANLFGGAVWSLDEIPVFQPPCPFAATLTQVQQTMRQAMNQMFANPNPITFISIPISIDKVIDEMKSQKCECGVAKCGGIHSDWCPAKEKP